MSAKIFYTSRSAIETYQRCPEQRRLGYLYNGTGITLKTRSVPLTTGTAVHEGIGYLLKILKLYPATLPDETHVDNACLLAQREYLALVAMAGFYGPGVKLDQQAKYTLQEQLALTEALIRLWAKVEMENLWNRFIVVGVERELLSKLVTYSGGVVYLQTRADAELIDRQDGSYYNYSLKTTKQWDDRAENAHKRDLQGITEIWGTEQEHIDHNIQVDNICEKLKVLYERTKVSKYLDILNWFSQKKMVPKRVMGVKFCFLIKGYWGPTQRGNPDSIYTTRNSLIRGWKNIGPSGIDYAHSYDFPNPENKSGWGRLGKGWELFDVWSDPNWGVKKWINSLEARHFQPECGEVLKQWCVTPPEYFRDEKEIQEAIEQISFQEGNVFSFLNGNGTWPKYRTSCHYPTSCQFNPICWGEGGNEEVRKDPVGSGLYQIRVPHHQPEKEYLEGVTNGD